MHVHHVTQSYVRGALLKASAALGALGRPAVLFGACRSLHAALSLRSQCALVPQGAPLIVLHSMLRVSGDLILKGLPDAAGVPGSWIVMPTVSIAGNQASLVFEVGSFCVAELMVVDSLGVPAAAALLGPSDGGRKQGCHVALAASKLGTWIVYPLRPKAFGAASKASTASTAQQLSQWIKPATMF